MTLGTNSRLAELLQKYVDKTITEEEYEELFFYIKNPDTKDEVLSFLDEHDKKVQADVFVNEVDWDAMYQNITSTKAPVTLLPFFIYAAAAIILVVGGFVIYYNNDSLEKSVELAYHNDVRPGKEKAILTLADGAQIVLEDGKVGHLTTQGDISIERDAKGQVVYKVNASSVADEDAKINTLSTPIGGKFSLVLADGSKVWLNASSTIIFPVDFAKDARRVTVVGEAYFEIKKDKTRPFYVKNGSSEIKVLGTHFNVMSYADEYESALTLLEGSVQFSKNGHSTLLRPGKQILYKESYSEIKQVDANIEEVMAWKNDLFVFNNTNIDEIMKELSRWYDVKVRYEGDKPDISFTGVIPRNANVSKVLRILELTGDVTFGIDKNVIICAKKTQAKK